MEAVANFFMILRAHMNVLYVIKVKSVFLIEWSYQSFPLPILLTIDLKKVSCILST